MLKRLAPLVVLAILVGLFFGFGGHKSLSFDAIALNYAMLTNYVADNPVLAAALTILGYSAATAVSFPAAWLITVAIGLVFGWAYGGVLVVIGATTGACILFLIARYALADFFRARAGNTLNKMAAGFRDNAVSYMLFLRLAPVFPFTMVNVVPAILGVPFLTYVWTTAIGIIPGVIAYAYAGEGLRSIVADRAEACMAEIAPCGAALTPGDLVTREILIAFLLLGIVSLLPVVIKRLRGNKAGDE